MKLFKTLAIVVGFAAIATLQAQTPQGNGESTILGPKAAFVRNQNYLNPSNQGNTNSVYTRDSLRGFDEDGIRRRLLARGMQMSEIMGAVEVQKREFIKQKYNLNPAPAQVGSSSSSGQGTQQGGRVIGGGNNVNIAPCVNEGFEATAPGAYNTATAVSGWTIDSRTNNSACNPTNWNAGSSEFSIVATPILTFPAYGNANNIGPIPHSPLGGTVVARLGDGLNGTQHMLRLRQTFPITLQNTLFQFAYAGYWEDGGSGHYCCPSSNDQPGIQVRMYDCGGNALACSSLSLFPGSGCQSSNVTYTTIPNTAQWTNWQVKYIDLTPFIGSCITVEFVNQDCAFSGHFGSTLLDVLCGGQLIGLGLGQGPGGSIAGPVSFCAGSNQAMISAPIGYSSYQWIAPGQGTIAPPQGTMSTLIIQSPVPGSVYTVQLVSASGCQYVSTNTIVFSQVNIAGIGSSSTCPFGSSGSATVQGNGSGTGYNYTWLNSSSVTVGTQSVVSGLAPGVYSIVLTGFGSAGCGSAVATTTVGTAQPSVTTLLKPYCSNEAYLNTAGGSNYKWYNNTTLITGTVGAQPGYTVSSPCNGCIYWVSYTTLQGCKDSTKFTLVQSQPGLLTVPVNQIKLVCPGATNGTATILMSPAPSAPPGFNSYSVASTGTTIAYTSSVYPTASNSYTVGGLQGGGTYTVVTFDGSCKYSTNFSVPQLFWNYTVTPNSPTLCPGNSIPASISFTSPPSSTQYSYSWTPTNWLVGGNGSLQNTIITPTGVTPGNIVTTIYTIVVTPTIAICPITKTMQITSVNPPTPTITPINPLCNTFAPYQILASPGGGTFTNVTPGLVGNLSGIITPSIAPTPTNSLVYTIKVNTCVATQNATFEVSQFNTAALTSTVPHLCVTNPAFNLMTIVQSTFMGTWSAQAPYGAAVQNNQFNPASLATGFYQISYNTVSTPNAATCPSVSTLNVQVTKTITPSIFQVNPFCNNAAPITMTVSPSGGGWSGPNISAGGVITPMNINQPGTSMVTYSINIGPCLNTNTTSFTVSRFNTAALTATSLPELCYSSSPVNLMSIVQSSVNGSWSGMGVPPGTNSFSPTYPQPLPTAPYTVTYNTTSTGDPNLCPDQSLLVIPLFNPDKPTISQVGPFCSADAPIQLAVTPNTGTWTSSSFLTSSGMFSPTNAAVGNNAVQYVIGTASCNKSDTKFINVEAFLPATITSKLPDLCNTSPAINLVPFTLTNLGGWSGPGISGTSFNPAVAGQGNWVLLHKTSSFPSGLCPDQSTVAITVYSLQAPVIDPVSPICNNAMPIQLNPSPVGGLFGGLNTGGVNLNGVFVPASGIIGKNIINYSITSGPCVAYAQTTINVEQFVSAEIISYPPKFCRTSDPMNMNTFVLNPGGNWTGPGIIGTMFNPKYAEAGSNTIRYTTHSMPTQTLCEDFREIQVIVNEIPKVEAISNTKGGCVPLEVIFNTPSANEGNGEWTLGDGSEPQKGLYISHIYTSPGTYSVVFNYSYEGCGTQARVVNDIVVHPVPEANFSAPDEILISNPTIQLTNLTPRLGDQRYSWKITGLADIEGEVHPKVEFPKIGKYEVTLVAETENHCKNQISKILEVKNDFQIFIPTSFSPNFDQLNDYFAPVFTPYGLDMRSFEMEIFDRWGHSLYRTRDISKGWDGSLNNKGEPLKEEVYIYKIRYKDLDGNAYSKMGHVSLVR